MSTRKYPSGYEKLKKKLFKLLSKLVWRKTFQTSHIFL